MGTQAAAAQAAMGAPWGTGETGSAQGHTAGSGEGLGAAPGRCAQPRAPMAVADWYVQALSFWGVLTGKG